MTIVRLPDAEGRIRRTPDSPAGLLRMLAAVDMMAKGMLLALLVLVLIDPAYGNLEGKAPTARAITYPLLAFALPAAWSLAGLRSRPFPWAADLLLTLTCFTDILGNRLDLYDQVTWFDDWMHFMNTGLLSAAALLLTTTSRTLTSCLERAVAMGLTMSLGWELFEYASFMTHSAERPMAYTDTLGDLALGWLGACIAALAVWWAHWRLPQPGAQVGGRVATTNIENPCQSS